MSFSESIQSCFAKYARFEGRASRSEYWWFSLFGVLMSWGSTVAGAVAFGELGGVLSLLVNLFLFLPSIAVLVRRLHDSERSGWWYWICLTIVGVIPVIIWLVSEGNQQENRYGPAPVR